MRKIRIGNKLIGESEPCFVIAEAGVNHNCDLDLAREMIKRAKWAGAGAIKFQTYKAERLVVKKAPIYWEEKGERESQFDIYKRLDRFGEPEYRELRDLANEVGIIFLSTPFDEGSSDLLEDIGVEAFKVSSGDITHLPLLTHIAKKGKPVILSTGMSEISEVREAVEVIERVGNRDIILLHCVASYPTQEKDANLGMIKDLQRNFPDYPIGFSDHTLGILIPTIAVALGAKLIEKHFTLDKTRFISGADHHLSLEPNELKQLIDNIKITESALGKEKKGTIEVEKETRTYARRSIVAKTKIPKGTKIVKEMLTCKRPGIGIAPKSLDKVIGKVTKEDIDEDEIIGWDKIKP